MQRGVSRWFRLIKLSCKTRSRPYGTLQGDYVGPRSLQKNGSLLIRFPENFSKHSMRQQPMIRRFSFESIPTVLLPPVAFIGLFLALWTYKCMMMVLFQDKIIYMPNVPPFSRSEKLEDYTNQCKPVRWESRFIRSLDGTKLALCIGSIPKSAFRTHIVICYFQGNGSSLPPRLPLLSAVLVAIDIEQVKVDPTAIQYTLVALSYRGYWTSSGRASQAGIGQDAQALLNWIQDQYSSPDHELEIILWGQSIGAGVASTAGATYVLQDRRRVRPQIPVIVLETPFSSVRNMLAAMYPQKWLPYGYLWPFLWNHWDSVTALKLLAQQANKPKILLLVATKDEIVPASESDTLERLCADSDLDFERQNIPGALHTEAATKRAGQTAVAKFIVETVNAET